MTKLKVDGTEIEVTDHYVYTSLTEDVVVA
jgi:hypothetical protein